MTAARYLDTANAGRGAGALHLARPRLPAAVERLREGSAAVLDEAGAALDSVAAVVRSHLAAHQPPD